MIKKLSIVNCFLSLLPIVFIASSQIQIVQGKPFILSIPLITVDRIKNFFSSLTNGVKGNTINPPSVNRLTESCHKSFTPTEGNLDLTLVETANNQDNQLQLMDLSSSYFLYSSENQTIIFSNVFNKVKQVNSPCPLEESICDLLPSIVTKDVPMNWLIANLLDNYWESCMKLIDTVVNETHVNHL